MNNMESDIKKLMLKIAYEQEKYDIGSEIFNIFANIEYDLHEILKGEFKFENNEQ